MSTILDDTVKTNTEADSPKSQRPTLIKPTGIAEKTKLQIFSPLIFTLFYFVDPVANPRGVAYFFVVFLTYGIQVWLYYLMATVKSQRLALGLIVVSMGLSFASSAENSTAYSFHWFCAYFGATRYRLGGALAVLALVLAVVFASAQVFDYNQLWYYLTVLIPVLGLFLFGLFDRQERFHEQAQQKSEQQIEHLAQVAERERIARDLHDVMGHSLTTIALKSQLADKLVKNRKYEAAAKEIAEVARVSSETLSEMRSVVTGYRAKSLQTLFKELCDKLSDWNFAVHSDVTLPELSAREESTLALVLTEAITNIIKHSKGNEVYFESTEDAKLRETWHLSIRDNGLVKHLKEGNGLSGMRERLNAINAQLELNTQNGMELNIALRISAKETES